ncbi:hypothetical protein ACFLZP_01660 [Patescibacteria group bacterium]
MVLKKRSAKFEYIDKKVKVNRFLLIPQGSAFNDIKFYSEYVLGEVLSDSRKFNLEIRKAREGNKLKQLIKLSEKIRPEELMNFAIDNLESREKLDVHAENILDEFGLGENWKIPIIIAILTDVLPIPIPDNGIHFYEGSGTPEFWKIRKVTKYPAIYFTRKISPKAIRKWLKQTPKIFEQYIDKLPPRQRVFHIKEENIWLGRLAWILKEDGLGWTKMVKVMDSYFDKQENEDFRSLWHSFDSDDMKKAYNSYKKAFSRIGQ